MSAIDLNRREFVKFVTNGALLSTQVGTLAHLAGCSSFGAKKINELPFTPLRPSHYDNLLLPEGLDYTILAEWGQKINTEDTFGFNNDYTAFLPISNQKHEGILWVNHEYPHPLFINGLSRGSKPNQAQVNKQRYEVGGSLLHLRRKDEHSKWEIVANSSYNRRITGQTPIPLIADRPIAGKRTAIGTLGNCAGGVTPWGTVLTCEENYDLFVGERLHNKKQILSSKLGWERHYNLPPEHYGWVVEVNPFTGAAKKLTALGRFAHECATCVKTNDGRTVVYSGDDRADQFIYKFIAERPGSLERGELFVADIIKGRWLSLDINKQEVLKKNFKDQLDILINCRKAGKLLGATPCDRPEDIEVNPFTGDVLVCLTNNVNRANYYGSILKIQEKGDHLSTEFTSSDFKMGGEEFACPDNMAFDRNGNLWMTTDMSGSRMNRPPYKKFKNNGLFFIPMAGDLKGQVFQVASAPRDAELTGVSFSTDGQTLFLSVQHPGENSRGLSNLTSHWPHGGDSLPRPCVVQIRGPALSKLTI